MALDLTIQIVNYQTKKYLTDCLTSIFDDLADLGLSYEILVLDNNSGDDLADLQEKYPEQVKFYLIEKNLGFGGGHNWLAQKGEGQFILILNPDIKFVAQGTTLALTKALKESSQVAVAGPKLINEHGIQRYDHGELNGFLAKTSLAFGGSYWRERKGAALAAWVSGAVFLIKREAFEKVGGFDEKFFLYKEEEDLCWRLRQDGWKIIYDPTVAVFHYGSVVASKGEHFIDSEEYFIKKHLPGRFFKVYFYFKKIVDRCVYRN